MADATVTCPNCGTDIKLTKSLAAPLLAAVRKKYDAELAARNAETALREREKLAEAQKAQLDVIRKERELHDEKCVLMVTAAKGSP